VTLTILRIAIRQAFCRLKHKSPHRNDSRRLTRLQRLDRADRSFKAVEPAAALVVGECPLMGADDKDLLASGQGSAAFQSNAPGGSLVRRERLEIAPSIQNEAGNFAGGGEYGLHGRPSNSCDADMKLAD